MSDPKGGKILSFQLLGSAQGKPVKSSFAPQSPPFEGLFKNTKFPPAAGTPVAIPSHTPSASGSANGTATASPKTPPPAYIPLAPTVMLAVFTFKVTS